MYVSCEVLHCNTVCSSVSPYTHCSIFYCDIIFNMGFLVCLFDIALLRGTLYSFLGGRGLGGGWEEVSL